MSVNWAICPAFRVKYPSASTRPLPVTEVPSSTRYAVPAGTYRLPSGRSTRNR